MGTTPIYGFPYPDPSDLVENYPALGQELAEDVEAAIAASSKIQKVVSTAKTDTFSTTSTSFVDITGLSASITPSSASNLVLVMVHLNWSIDYTTGGLQTVIVRESTNIGIGDAAGDRLRTTWNRSASFATQTTTGTNSMAFLDSPATTSATTYKVQAAVNAGTAYFGRTVTDTDSNVFSRSIQTITLMEVTP